MRSCEQGFEGREKMRILFIGPLPEPVTGMSLACRVFLDGIPNEYPVDVVDQSKSVFRQGVSSFERVIEVLRILWKVWRKRKQADVIYLTVSVSVAGNVKDLLIYLLCFSQLQHMVIHLHGGASVRKTILREGSLLRGVNAFFLRRLGAVIVLGETLVGTYSGVVPRGRIQIVPNFAEDSLFTDVEKIECKFDQPLPMKLLFLSNLLPGKGYIELVEAFLGLDEKTKALIEVDFAGGFESEKDKKQFLAKVALAPQIRYHGTVAGDRKRHLFQQAHVFCLPTHYPYEGQPISILEAYASGCAVITTDHSGIRDVFRDKVNGFQVAKTSVADLRRAIERALAEPELLRRMAVTNLKAAQKNYTTALYRKALSSIIESVARRP